MFKKIKELFKNFTSQLVETIKYKSLSDKDINEITEEFMLKLIEADVAYDVAELLTNNLRRRLQEIKIPRGINEEEFINKLLRESVYDILSRGRASIDLVNLAKERKPLKVIFMGVNGVGKTTTIAKVAYLLLKNSLKPVIVAADTFRAAAQEQLKKHSEVLGVPFIGGKYGADPAAVAYDGILYASKRGLDAVLIDTAGRMHVDIDLMNELKKVVRVSKPDLKVLILDALAGNDAIEQAKAFNESVGIDGVILTKVDADVKGGAALTVILGVNKPILYLGVGQKYEDLIPYDPEVILRLLF
ncbi:MAG TPA: signal recognition particle-docking protein FtsY [Ignisphaera sp.]|nr:signal recognition particle-docking protein FtsY [Ignisphaera sp.]